MSQLSRAVMRLNRAAATVQLNRRLSSAAFISPKLFSTEASEPSLGASGDQFFQTTISGPLYGKLVSITKHMTKSDLINFLEGCNLSPEKLKVEYNRSYLPMSMMVEFPSKSSYDAALKTINRNGRLYNLMRAEKADWDTIVPYDGKAIILHGIPRNALSDDVERFLSGCQYDSSSIQMFVRPTNQGSIRMARVNFHSQALAMHAYITKNRGFCLNNQITMQVLH